MPSKTAHQPYFDDWPIIMFLYLLLDMVLLYHPIQRLNITIKENENETKQKRKEKRKMENVIKWLQINHKLRINDRKLLNNVFEFFIFHYLLSYPADHDHVATTDNSQWKKNPSIL